MTDDVPPFTWKPVPGRDGGPGEASIEILEDEHGNCIAMVEQFYAGHATYPTAVNFRRGGVQERGGPRTEFTEAKAWCERVVGLHPLKLGDEMPPFYYSCDRTPCVWRECFHKGCPPCPTTS